MCSAQLPRSQEDPQPTISHHCVSNPCLIDGFVVIESILKINWEDISGNWQAALGGEMKAVVKILQSMPEIVDCDRVTSEDCFIARAHVRSVAHMAEVIDQLTAVAMTNTSIVQSSPVARRLPLFS